VLPVAEDDIPDVRWRDDIAILSQRLDDFRLGKNLGEALPTNFDMAYTDHVLVGFSTNIDFAITHRDLLVACLKKLSDQVVIIQLKTVDAVLATRSA
jgi:hypothetical protein